VLFVIIGNAASGGPYARVLLPGFWRDFGGLLLPGAGVDLTRNILFFDGSHSTGPIVVLLVWALAGSALDLALGGRTVAPDIAEREVASAAVL
jgi:hypothetical protein